MTFEIEGCFYTINELCKKFNLKYDTLYRRLFTYKMPLEKAIRKRPKKVFNYHGKMITYKEGAKIAGIKLTCLMQRLKYGYSFEEAIDFKKIKVNKN